MTDIEKRAEKIVASGGDMAEVLEEQRKNVVSFGCRASVSLIDFGLEKIAVVAARLALESLEAEKGAMHTQEKQRLTKHFAKYGVGWDEFDTVDDFLDKVEEEHRAEVKKARREMLEQCADWVGEHCEEYGYMAQQMVNELGPLIPKENKI